MLRNIKWERKYFVKFNSGDLVQNKIEFNVFFISTQEFVLCSLANRNYCRLLSLVWLVNLFFFGGYIKELKRELGKKEAMIELER